ncbi:hypothetical protein FIBSPDRAFT_873021 [Athelia psychrophila]|uniref:Uncharacterized protein n=1 Tax=Athelia psychrophila TaxID=1759441 RepID=A0A165YYW8_9AGAM|nr:hypothetical protein FIBSPDRAFT_873021 [Fibularhizoctonia sp. CBS 109695]
MELLRQGKQGTRETGRILTDIYFSQTFSVGTHWSSRIVYAVWGRRMAFLAGMVTGHEIVLFEGRGMGVIWMLMHVLTVLLVGRGGDRRVDKLCTYREVRLFVVVHDLGRLV